MNLYLRRMNLIMGKETINGIEVDINKANRLLQKLIMIEKINIKSKEFNDSQMVKKIQKMIEEEVQCY